MNKLSPQDEIRLDELYTGYYNKISQIFSNKTEDRSNKKSLAFPSILDGQTPIEQSPFENEFNDPLEEKIKQTIHLFTTNIINQLTELHLLRNQPDEIKKDLSEMENEFLLLLLPIMQEYKKTTSDKIIQSLKSELNLIKKLYPQEAQEPNQQLKTVLDGFNAELEGSKSNLSAINTNIKSNIPQNPDGSLEGLLDPFSIPANIKDDILQKLREYAINVIEFAKVRYPYTNIAVQDIVTNDSFKIVKNGTNTTSIIMACQTLLLLNENLISCYQSVIDLLESRIGSILQAIQIENNNIINPSYKSDSDTTDTIDEYENDPMPTPPILDDSSQIFDNTSSSAYADYYKKLAAWLNRHPKVKNAQAKNNPETQNKSHQLQLPDDLLQ